MKFEVLLTRDAEGDLADLGAFLLDREGPLRAGEIIARLENAVLALERFPRRGSVPAEFERLGINEYRQLVSNPWRIIYRIDGKRVHVMVIADGRRDMQALLLRRLLNR